MKPPDFVRRHLTATSSTESGPRQPTGDKFRNNHDRIFGKKPTRKPGYTIIRYVNGKRVEVNNCEVKTRAEIGLAPLKVTGI